MREEVALKIGNLPESKVQVNYSYSKNGKNIYLNKANKISSNSAKTEKSNDKHSITQY